MVNLSEKLQESTSSSIFFSTKILGFDIYITDTVVTMWIIMLALVTFALVFTRKLKTIPEGKQNFVEMIVDLINNFTKGNIGHHWRSFAPYLGTLLMFLAFSNIVSIFNFSPLEHYKLRPPTRNVNVTASMAVISIGVMLFAGIRFKGVKGWLKGFIQPSPVILPFKIMDYFIRPLSLCMRLFGNIIGAFIIMKLLEMVIPVFLPGVLSIYFDLFDGFIQAYIFVFLTSLYISEAIE